MNKRTLNIEYIDRLMIMILFLGCYSNGFACFTCFKNPSVVLSDCPVLQLCIPLSLFSAPNSLSLRDVEWRRSHGIKCDTTDEAFEGAVFSVGKRMFRWRNFY